MCRVTLLLWRNRAKAEIHCFTSDAAAASPAVAASVFFVHEQRTKELLREDFIREKAVCGGCNAVGVGKLSVQGMVKSDKYVMASGYHKVTVTSDQDNRQPWMFVRFITEGDDPIVIEK